MLCNSEAQHVEQEGKAQDHREVVKKVKASFEGTVVRPVEAVLLGLQKDTVYWQKGLLSSPPVSQIL